MNTDTVLALPLPPEPAPAPSHNEIVITVYGAPGPQGSKRHLGNGVMIESSKKVKPWRQDVKDAALDAMEIGGRVIPVHRPPLDGPLALHVVFTAVRPKSHYRTGRNAHLLRDSAPARPSGPPDLSKLIRSTEDALTEAGAWVDDARVVEVFAEKRFAGEGPDALDRTGAVIRIRSIGDPS